uniref:Aquaporin 14 n=1 Tax=Catharus ustulatus TaxID=91951 RepID=A0A8C3UCQ9_CATUS
MPPPLCATSSWQCLGRFWRGVLAELVATLIFVGVVLGASAAPGPLAPALAGGLVAGGLVCALGGPQANPALTLALLCTRKLSTLRGAAGVLAQCTGATLASAAPPSTPPPILHTLTPHPRRCQNLPWGTHRIGGAPCPLPFYCPLPRGGIKGVLGSQVGAE